MDQVVEYASVWDHFQRTDDEIAACAMCNKPIRCKNSSTTGLHRHLELIHHLKRCSPLAKSSASSSKHTAAVSARKRRTASEVKSEATPLIEYNNLWDHFQKIGEIASCRLCTKFLQCKSNGTSGLHRHLEAIHAMKRFKRPRPDTVSTLNEAEESSTATDPSLAILQVDGGTYASVYDHFQRTGSSDSAECRICGKIIQCKSSSTSGLRRHLEMVHSKQRQHGHTPTRHKHTERPIKIKIEKLPLLSPVLMDDRPSYDSVWDHFQSLGDVAECLMCWKRIQCKASSTSGLHRHLERVHDMQRRRLTPPPAEEVDDVDDVDYDQMDIPTAQHLPNLQQAVTTTSLLDNKRTLEQIVAELVAKDGISMAAIANSSFIRSSLIVAGYPHPPTDPSAILRMVLTVAEQVRNQLVAKIASTKSEQRRFSVAVADWHGCRSRRYRQVLLYYDNGDTDHLGLIRRRRLTSAAELGDRVADKLTEFGIDWRTDVVACTSDDISTVEWSGEQHGGPHRQRCYVEGIRAAVMAVLFRQRSAYPVKIENDDYTQGGAIADEEDDDAVTSVISGDDDYDDAHDKTVHLAPEFNVVSKVRGIVRWFRSSAVNTAVLLEYTPAGGQLLSKRCRWRWDSIETVLTEYIRLRQPVEQALQHLGRADLANMSAEQLQQCVRIVQALKPIRLAVDTLQRTDANLLRADAVLRFLFTNLAAQRTEMGTSFLESLQQEFGTRREATMSAVVGLLCGPKTPAGGGRWPQRTEDDAFRLPGQQRVLEAAEVMWRRLFELPCNSEQCVTDAGDPLSVMEAIVGDADAYGIGDRTDDDELTNELEMYLQQVSVPSTATRSTSTAIADELKEFANGGQQTQNVRRLMSALGTIRPTVAERSRFGATRRTRECDEAVDSVCLLEYFLNKTRNK